MVKLEDITKDSQIRCLHGREVVKIVSVDKFGDSAISVVYQTGVGRYSDQILRR